MNQVNTVMHLGAARAREGLADTEEFLILCLHQRCYASRKHPRKRHGLPLECRSIVASRRICLGTNRGRGLFVSACQVLIL
jgi:hypothetical protein